MYITPNSDIRLLSGCPIDESYNHTLYFSSATEQADYFLTLTKPTYGLFSKVSYQRAGKNTIRLQVLADNIYDCNYLMFRNTAYGTKWFYAFINRIEYINDNVTEIEYTIDVMQTWYFDYELGQCFVEREHSLSDHIGENVVEENLELNELQECETIIRLDLTPDIICFWLSAGYYKTIDETSGNITWRKVVAEENKITYQYDEQAHVMISNPSMKLFSLTTAVDNLNLPNVEPTASYIPFLNALNTEDIINATLFSSKAYSGTPLTPYERIIEGNWTKNLGSYIPKNNKLYTYPYNIFYMTNGAGQTAILRIERFLSNIPLFRLSFDRFYSPAVSLMPVGYQRDEETVNPEYAITVNNFPPFPVITKALDAWLNKNQASLATSSVASAVTGGLAIMAATTTTGKVLAGAALATRIAGTIGKIVDLANTPASATNISSNDVLKAVTNTYRLAVYRKCVIPEYAKIIDDYFTMFGYATRRVKYPYVRQYSKDSLRPHWNFIKTQGCIIHSSRTLGKGLPAEAEAQISKIYDNGITFWMDGNEVGDYSLDNSPPTPKNGG